MRQCASHVLPVGERRLNGKLGLSILGDDLSWGFLILRIECGVAVSCAILDLRGGDFLFTSGVLRSDFTLSKLKPGTQSNIIWTLINRP